MKHVGISWAEEIVDAGDQLMRHFRPDWPGHEVEPAQQTVVTLAKKTLDSNNNIIIYYLLIILIIKIKGGVGKIKRGIHHFAYDWDICGRTTEPVSSKSIWPLESL